MTNRFMVETPKVRLTLEYEDIHLEVEAPDYPELNLSQWASNNAEHLAKMAQMMYRTSHKESKND